ncbi:MAG: dienelactone hydrolase [Caulobacteraceae bacterium]|nr:dienelactone hydrolase [Caulobacteraceae bacterium]
MTRRALAGALIALWLGAAPARAGVDEPELASPGPFAVGIDSLTFTQAAQPDVLSYDPRAKTLPRRDRALPIDVWYPADPPAGAARVVYAGALTGEDGAEVPFTAPGLAVRRARARAGPFPLVILAHGYGGAPALMSWLAEALASRGYVVVGPRFGDPPITEATKFVGPLARRPLDIAFVAAEAQARARRRQGVLASADPSLTALIGYSMGGYGVLAGAGASLDPELSAATRGALAPYVRGGREAAALKVAGLKAVVAISPASRLGGGEAWGGTGLAAITTPTLFIAGDQDKVVGYDPGVKTLFGEETRAPRYLLTFENAGHSIGMNPAPREMRGRLWDQDWFEDAVWRKDRVLAIERHFIIAFLDLYVKGDAAMAAYLNPPTALSNDGVWPPAPGEHYDAFSPGVSPITVWKGFRRGQATGLELRFAPASP